MTVVQKVQARSVDIRVSVSLFVARMVSKGEERVEEERSCSVRSISKVVEEQVHVALMLVLWRFAGWAVRLLGGMGRAETAVGGVGRVVDVVVGGDTAALDKLGVIGVGCWSRCGCAARWGCRRERSVGGEMWEG